MPEAQNPHAVAVAVAVAIAVPPQPGYTIEKWYRS